MRVDTLKHPENMAQWHVEEKPLRQDLAGGLYVGPWGMTIMASTMPFVLHAGVCVGKIAFPAGRHLFPPIGMFAGLKYDPADNDPANEFKVLRAMPPECHDQEYRNAAAKCLAYDYPFVIVTAARAGLPSVDADEHEVLIELHGFLGWSTLPQGASRVTVFQPPRLPPEIRAGIKCLVVQSVALDTLRQSPAFRAYWTADAKEQLTVPPRGLFYIREDDVDEAVALMVYLLKDVDEDAKYAVRDVRAPTLYLQDGPALDAVRAQWRTDFESTVGSLPELTGGNVVFVPATEPGAGAPTA